MKPQKESIFVLLVSIVFGASTAIHNRKVNILSTHFSENCGETFSDRIIGGKNASLGQFPWMARVDVQEYGFECGGALISDRHVLSAAHCIADGLKILGVLLGEHDTKTNPDCEDDFCANSSQYIKVASYSIPDDYDESNYAHDILLIKLAHRAQFNDFVIPICLPTGNEIKQSANEETDVAEVAGWGAIDSKSGAQPRVLQYTKINIQRIEKCQKAFIPFTIDATRQICAGGGSNAVHNRDSCTGDSGGPLMQILIGQHGPRYFMTGIVSFGRLSCGGPDPAIYTRVLSYLNFISKNIENDFKTQNIYHCNSSNLMPNCNESEWNT